MINTEFIRVERARQNLTQIEIARRTGLNINTVSAICNGKDTRISTLSTFASALRVPVHKLLLQSVAA